MLQYIFLRPFCSHFYKETSSFILDYNVLWRLMCEMSTLYFFPISLTLLCFIKDLHLDIITHEQLWAIKQNLSYNVCTETWTFLICDRLLKRRFTILQELSHKSSFQTQMSNFQEAKFSLQPFTAYVHIKFIFILFFYNCIIPFYFSMLYPF